MKKFIILIFGLFFISMSANSFIPSNFGDEEVNVENVFANKFYIYDSQGNVVYLSKQNISKMWENKLKEEGKDVSLSKFEILKSKDEKSGKEFYFLKTTSTDKTIQTGAFFTKTKLGMLLGDKECTCAGCPSGCNLSTFGSNCSCSSCGLGGPQNCTKTEKVVIKDATFGISAD